MANLGLGSSFQPLCLIWCKYMHYLHSSGPLLCSYTVRHMQYDRLSQQHLCLLFMRSLIFTALCEASRSYEIVCRLSVQQENSIIVILLAYLWIFQRSSHSNRQKLPSSTTPLSPDNRNPCEYPHIPYMCHFYFYDNFGICEPISIFFFTFGFADKLRNIIK